MQLAGPAEERFNLRRHGLVAIIERELPHRDNVTPSKPGENQARTGENLPCTMHFLGLTLCLWVWVHWKGLATLLYKIWIESSRKEHLRAVVEICKRRASIHCPPDYCTILTAFPKAYDELHQQFTW